MNDFLGSPAYCRDLRVKITGSKSRINNLSQDDKLIAAINLFNDIQKVLEDNSSVYTGTKKFFGKPLSSVLVDKIHIYTEGVGQTSQSIINNKQQSISLDVSKKPWFVFDDNYGTDEEKSLIRFIDSVIVDLEKKYKNIYLLQNIKFVKLYDFQKGRGFEPDFILFVEDKKSGKALNYQLFIEPKGPQLLEHDSWKQVFLKQITAQHELTSELEGLSYDSEDYRLVGLPFYTEDRNKQDFIMDFKDQLKI